MTYPRKASLTQSLRNPDTTNITIRQAPVIVIVVVANVKISLRSASSDYELEKVNPHRTQPGDTALERYRMEMKE